MILQFLQLLFLIKNIVLCIVHFISLETIVIVRLSHDTLNYLFVDLDDKKHQLLLTILPKPTLLVCLVTYVCCLNDSVLLKFSSNEGIIIYYPHELSLKLNNVKKQNRIIKFCVKVSHNNKFRRIYS